MSQNATETTAGSEAPPARPRNPQPWSERRINAIAEATGAKTYLEIGVSSGSTFRTVKIAEKTGVDPAFKFDIEAERREGVDLCKMTSDDFFQDLPVEKTYDFIFIDGLHTFEQTYRDLTNCLQHSHNRTVFLIDDTIPNDVYSALRDQAAAKKFRAAAGRQSGAWHGDVFKVVFAIHDFHPGLDFRTITGSGNPQTLVWRSARTGRKPRFDNLERISRLTYFDLQNAMGVMKRATEAQAMEALRRSFGL